MPEQMTAALDNGAGKYVVQKTAMPDRAPGSVLIRVRQTGIRGSDLHMTRERTEAQKVPSGHEVAGEIVELPKGIRAVSGQNTPLKVGDRVAIETIGSGRSCGTCYFCRQGQFRHCIARTLDSGGGFAEYMTRMPGGCFVLPDSVDWTDGALVEPLAVSVHALRYSASMKPGDTVAVVGSATIGLAAIVAAKALGAKKIFASARYEQQGILARELGADVVTTSEKGALEDAVKSATGGLGADVAVETIGGHTADTLTQSVACTRPQGRVVIVGGFREPVKFNFLEPLLVEHTFVFSSCYGIVDARHDYEVAIEMLAGSQSASHFPHGSQSSHASLAAVNPSEVSGIPFRKIVTHRFSLKDIQKGFDTAYDKGTGSVKVHITQ